MKSLWVVNKNCGALHIKNFGKKSTGGLWLDAMLDQVKEGSDDKVVVVNIEKQPKTRYLEDGQIVYYTLKGEPNFKYDYQNCDVISQWKAIIEKEQPDIIELWGTELPYGLAAISAAPNIPVVVFIQGIIDSIARYYKSGMSDAELHQAISIRDVLTKSTISQIQKRFYTQSEYEHEIITKAKNIIVENEWAKAYCKRIAKDASVYYLPISISDSFKSKKWDINKITPHTLMCSAANYPIKGLHMLLKALALVKREYPDVKLYIPGTKISKPNSFIEYIKLDGYSKFILRMINNLGLQNVVSYTGRLTADEMALKMTEVNGFVMSSAIENHSSTLKEAMMVGTPCVASYVGGVPEYALNQYNCLLYRYEDYEVLANLIIELFRNRDLCMTLSENEKKSMLEKEKIPGGYPEMRLIFESCIRNN